MDVAAVNGLGFADFTEKFGNIIEHCPVLGAAVWSSRPFRNLDELHKVFVRLIDELPFAVQEGILRCHPDLAGRIASAGSLTAESTKEQSSAGLLQLTNGEKQTLTERNNAYKAKFGFPFVICARQNKKDAIFTGIHTRLGNSVESEVHTGIEEVKKIGYLRLCDVIDVKSEARL